jgi:adenosylcobinamide-GDP ribazoletransferase
MLPFWIALQFLSSLPIRLPGMPTPQQSGRSLLFYPLVGLLFGLLLLALNQVLEGSLSLLHAALLLGAWVMLSGGLHLDGRSGPIAVVTLVVVLLLKFSAALAVVEAHCSLGLLLAPVIARTAMLALFMNTPYVRPGGLGQALADHLPRSAGLRVLATVALFCVLMGGWAAVWVLLICTGSFFWLRRVMIRRLGGSTGDTAGAMLELLETLVLVTLALM